jgi:hypothetical protein
VHIRLPWARTTDTNGSNNQFSSFVFINPGNLPFSLEANPNESKKHRILAHSWHKGLGCARSAPMLKKQERSL